MKPMKSILSTLAITLGALAASLPATAQLSVRDDLNRVIIVKKPATRVVTLAPFLTEMLFEVGAGDLAVGVDEHSDYPPQAFSVPKVGSGASFSIERIATLKPDLVLAWKDGIKREDAEHMTQAGAMVFVASAHQLEDVTRLMQVIGQLTGRDPTKAIAIYESKLDRLRRENAFKVKLTTFLEIWNRPLTTISASHFLAEALEICRAENVFADRKGSAPKISWEDLASRDPFLIIGNGSASSPEEFRSNWEIRQSLSAVKGMRLLYLADESISRPGPRTPDGIAKLCAQLDDVRAGKVQQMAATAQAPAAEGMPLKPSLGPFAPSIANPVPSQVAGPSAPAKLTVPTPLPAAAKAPVAAPAAAAVETPKPPTETPGKRPSQYGM